jgi:Ca2+-binding EF-hand superfamily protein
MSEVEVVALTLNADLNGDGAIDYEEFMKHFRGTLKMIRFHNKVQEIYTEIKATEKGSGMKSAAKAK